MKRVTQTLGMYCVLSAAAAGCSFHGEYHASTGNAPASQSAPANPPEASGGEAPSGGRRHGVHVSVTPHGHHQGNSAHAAEPAPAAPATHQATSSAASPIAGMAAQPAPVAPPTHQATSSAASPIAGMAAQPAPATHDASSAAASPIAGLPAQPAPAPATGGRVDPGAHGSSGIAPSTRPETRASCRPFTLTARNGDVLRLRVVAMPDTAVVRLDDRTLNVASRSGQVWVVEVPADATTGDLTLADGATTLRCGRLATSAK